MNCKECGYATGTIRFGITFSDHRIIGPALDTELGEIVEVDYENIPGSVITPYSSKNLQKAGTQKNYTNIYNCCEHQLQGEGNFCPSCNGFTLSVLLSGMID
jgi:hypothetical protein